MKIDKRDVYSFLIAVMVVTITSVIQIENPIEDKATQNTAQTASNNNNLAIVGLK